MVEAISRTAGKLFLHRTRVVKQKLCPETWLVGWLVGDDDVMCFFFFVVVVVVVVVVFLVVVVYICRKLADGPEKKAGIC